jgi:hypothetical protein
MKWLDNSDSVSLEQLEATSKITLAKVHSARKGSGTFEFSKAITIDAVAYFATCGKKVLVGKWVDKYFDEVTGEDKQTYINAIKGTK